MSYLDVIALVCLVALAGVVGWYVSWRIIERITGGDDDDSNN